MAVLDYTGSNNNLITRRILMAPNMLKDLGVAIAEFYRQLPILTDEENEDLVCDMAMRAEHTRWLRRDT
jgi:hypothetical protein